MIGSDFRNRLSRLADSRLAIPSAGCRFFTGRSGGACVARGVNGWSAQRVLAEISQAKTFSADFASISGS
jgi:hypothetical protein